MKGRAYLLAAAAALPLAVGGCWYLQRQAALNTALKWTRLASPPSTATHYELQVDGSAFTREFRISFVAPPGDIAQWLGSSPGVADAVISKSGSITIYRIKPGGGAQFAEVQVDESSGVVTIRTYWS